MAVGTPQGQTGPEQRQEEQPRPVSPAATEAGLERVMFAAHEDSGLEESHIRSSVYRAHSAMLTQMGGPEKVLEALDTLRQSGAISEGAAAIYREALTSAGGDSAKFADTIVQRRAELAQVINNDLTTGTAAGIAILDNVDRSMSAGQVQGRVKLAYESLLEVSNNDMTALNAAIDRAVEGGQLNADNARVVRNAAQQAGTDANRFAQLVSENKDGLAQLAVLQAQQGNNGPGGATGPGGPGAGGIFGAMFAGMDPNNPLMQMINAIIMAFTNGRMNLDTIMNRTPGQQGPAQTAAGGATTERPASGAGATETPAETPAQTTPVVAATAPETAPEGGTPAAETAEPEVQPVAAQDGGTRVPIVTTAVSDDTGITTETTPEVDHEAGTIMIAGMSMGDRFGMNANPDPTRVTPLDPRVDPGLQTGEPRIVQASFDASTLPRWNPVVMA